MKIKFRGKVTCKGQTLAMCTIDRLVASGQGVTQTSTALSCSNWKKNICYW